MAPPLEDGGDQGGVGRPDFLGPADEALGRPLTHPAVLLGHVLRHGGVTPPARGPDVTGDALAAVEALDGAGRQSDVELSSDQRVGDGVVVPVDLDVVVDVHAGGLPLGEDVGSGRSAGRSSCSNWDRREPGSLRNGRALSRPRNSAMAVLSPTSEKNVRWRRAASTHSGRRDPRRSG